MAALSPALRNMKFMKGVQENAVPQAEQTLAYYICHQPVLVSTGPRARQESTAASPADNKL